MNTLTRLDLGIITAALTAAAMATTPPASAATITVSPGDRVDYVSPTAGTQFCTVGYVYTAPDLLKGCIKNSAARGAKCRVMHCTARHFCAVARTNACSHWDRLLRDLTWMAFLGRADSSQADSGRCSSGRSVAGAGLEPA
jgi:hypothetical protein